MRDVAPVQLWLGDLPHIDVERLVADELFTVSGTSIGFRAVLVTDNDPTSIHSPLAHLNRFMMHWGSLIPPDYKTICEQWSAGNILPNITATDSPHFNPNDPIWVYPKLRGDPSDIFSSLIIQHDVVRQEQRKEMQSALDLVRRKVQNAEFVDLFGAIGIPSIVNVLAFLEQNDFNGRLRVYDVSPVPIVIGKKYQELGLLPANMDFFHTSVFELSHQQLQEQSSSLVLADVLGYYLTDEEYALLTEYAQMTLKNEGIFLIRDLVDPVGIIPIEKRTVGGIAVKEFTDFIRLVFPNVTLPQNLAEELPKLLRWPTPNQRRFIDEYWGPMAASFDLRANIRTTPSPDCQRVFLTSLWQKSE